MSNFHKYQKYKQRYQNVMEGGALNCDKCEEKGTGFGFRTKSCTDYTTLPGKNRKITCSTYRGEEELRTEIRKVEPLEKKIRELKTSLEHKDQQIAMLGEQLKFNKLTLKVFLQEELRNVEDTITIGTTVEVVGLGERVKSDKNWNHGHDLTKKVYNAIGRLTNINAFIDKFKKHVDIEDDVGISPSKQQEDLTALMGKGIDEALEKYNKLVTSQQEQFLQNAEQQKAKLKQQNVELGRQNDALEQQALECTQKLSMKPSTTE